MSLKKARKIVEEVDEELGISLVSYDQFQLEFLRNKVDQLLALDVSTEDLESDEDFREHNSDDSPELMFDEEESDEEVY